MATANDGCADQFDIAMMRREIEAGNEQFLAAMLLVAEHVPADRTTRHHLGLMVQVLVPALRAARQRIAELEGELSQDARIFMDYAGLHAAKGTPDGERKAAANREHAERIVALLATTPAAREGERE